MLPTPRSAGLTISRPSSGCSTPRSSTPQGVLAPSHTSPATRSCNVSIDFQETVSEQSKSLPSIKSLDILPSEKPEIQRGHQGHYGDRCVIVEDHIVIERERDTKSRDGPSDIQPWSRLLAGPRFFNGYKPNFDSRRPGTSASATSSISSMSMSIGTSNSTISEGRPGTACSTSSVHAALPPFFTTPPPRDGEKSCSNHMSEWDPRDIAASPRDYAFARSTYFPANTPYSKPSGRPSTSHCSPASNTSFHHHQANQRPSTSSGAFTDLTGMDSPMLVEPSLANSSSSSRSITPMASPSSPRHNPFDSTHLNPIDSPFELGDLPRIPTNLFVPPRLSSEPTENDREAAEILAAVAGLTSSSNSSAGSGDDGRAQTPEQNQNRSQASPISEPHPSAHAHHHADPRDSLFRGGHGRRPHYEREPAYHPYASQQSRAGPSLQDYYRHIGSKMLHPHYTHGRPVPRPDPYPRPIDAYESYMDQRRRASLGEDEASRVQQHLAAVAKPILAGELYRQASWEGKHLKVPGPGDGPSRPSVLDLGAQASQDKRVLQETTDADRPFACPGCDRTFARRYDRNRHARKHTGEKPYICGNPACAEEFGRPDALQRHYRASSKCEDVRLQRKRKIGPSAPSTDRGSSPSSDRTSNADMDRPVSQ